jgi:DNA-binding NtrC family response regulator
LRVLQEKTIQRLGGDRAIPVDVRVLAATHRDLETAIQNREFREDLFYRIGGMTLWLPPLAERKEDIPELVHHFIRRHAGDLGVPDSSVLDEAMALLREQSWPGNVRELENVVRQALLLARPFPVGAQHVRQALDKSSGLERDTQASHAAYVSHLLDRVEKGEVTKAYWQMVSDLEPELFAQAIARAGGNQAKAARWLGITRLKMREKLSEFGIHPSREDGPEAPPTD